MMFHNSLPSFLLSLICILGATNSSLGQGVKISPTSVIVGVDTVNNHTAVHATQGGLLLEGTTGSTPISGAGTRMMWIPEKGAFRAGSVDGTQWDAENIGDYSSVGGGRDNTASGGSSFVGGGFRNTASESSSFVGGGDRNTASSLGSFVGGGYENTASGGDSFVGGGYANTASGGDSFVGGGQSNTASGNYSFVGGGIDNTAASYGEVVLGVYAAAYPMGHTIEDDTWQANDRIFSIGNGTATNNRSNAMTVLKNGKVGLGTIEPGALLHLKQSSNTNSSGLRIQSTESSFMGVSFPENYWDIYTSGSDLQFYFNGSSKSHIDAGTGGFVHSSDRQLKRDIQPLDEVMPRLMQLKPASYYYKDVVTPERRAWGFIAQEVGEVFPNLMHQSSEYKGLNYDDFAVMAIKALQEQQLEITDLNTEITDLNTEITDLSKEMNNQQLENETLRNELDDLRALVEQLLDKQDQQHDTPITLNQVPALQQNEPNPTTGMTRVGYFLPEGKSGELRINSITGQELQRIPLPTVGAGHIDLQTRNLPAGTYTYSLIVDDQLIDTKRMIRQ